MGSCPLLEMPQQDDSQACDGSFCCGLQLQVLDILHKENAAPCTTSLALLTKESESVDLLQNSIVANMLFDMQSVTATFPDYKTNPRGGWRRTPQT